MMFDHAHYVPVLRWKPAERAALREMDPMDKDALTPLLELLPGYLRGNRASANNSAGADLAVAIAQIPKAWGLTPIFVDVERASDLPYRGRLKRSVSHFFEALVDEGVHAVPVARPDGAPAFQTALREAIVTLRTGVCVRVPMARLATSNVARDLRELVARLGVDLAAADLVVDYGLVGTGDPSFSDICNRLADIAHWRTFTVLGGSFPPNLTCFKVGQWEIGREEWARWMAQAGDPAHLARRPSFGDYTIQHPVYHEPVAAANVSASIRYTSDDRWVIMRGEGLRNAGSAGHAQYPANAELLCARKEFCGPHFSRGDEYIWRIGSRQDMRTGNPMTWLQAGINHHLTFAARQVPATLTTPG
jgi:hypothetical protein